VKALVARLDNDGDVLLAGPAIRAVKASGAHVTLLCGPRGRRAAELLPGVDALLCWRAPWIDPEPGPVDPADVDALVAQLRDGAFDEAHVLTSFHQSALPLALLLRLAGVPWIGAISEDYPGSLLDHRGRDPGDVHEVQRSLGTVAAAGHTLPAGDDGGLAVALGATRSPLPGGGPYVVVHPGASAPARAPSPRHAAAIVAALAEAGRRVVVTGAPGEAALTAQVAAPGAEDLGGRTSLPELARVLEGADCVVAGNTGPAHLAAAVRTPVVSLFAPVVPAERWRPWGVPHELLGRQDAPCAGSRARVCPVPGHPCLDAVPPAAVTAAVDRLAGPLAGGAELLEMAT
jgi:ADP-heptose:LPS heptosyltransferase